MKKSIFILAVIISYPHLLLNAQETKNSNLKLKVYYNFNRINYSETFHFSGYDLAWIQPAIEYHNSGELSVALQKESQKSYVHEFELMPFALTNSNLTKVTSYNNIYEWNTENKNSTVINSRFRYQLNYPVTTSQRFKSYIGISSMLIYSGFKLNSYTSSDFPERYSRIGIILGLSPGLEFPLSDNLNLTIDVPIGIYGLNYNSFKTENPALELEDRKENNFSEELWHQGFQVRIGLGFNL